MDLSQELLYAELYRIPLSPIQEKPFTFIVLGSREVKDKAVNQEYELNENNICKALTRTIVSIFVR